MRTLTPRPLTPMIVGEILQHEGLAREAYRDSVGVWTWSVGITDASGHKVARYRDNPQPLERCLEVFMWLLTTRYLPAVNAAFGAFDPTEHQLAAALSFHYNTGAIARARRGSNATSPVTARARAQPSSTGAAPPKSSPAAARSATCSSTPRGRATEWWRCTRWPSRGTARCGRGGWKLRRLSTRC